MTWRRGGALDAFAWLDQDFRPEEKGAVFETDEIEDGA